MAKSYALTTVDRIEAFMGKTFTEAQEAVVSSLIDQVTEFIENYIGYRLKQTTYSQEEYDTDESDSLLLKRFPINSSSQFLLEQRTSGVNEDDWQEVDGQYYHVDYDAGIIYGVSGLRFGQSRRGYRVTYTAGYSFDNSATFLSDTKAGDIELAAWMLVASVWNRRKGGSGVAEESVGDYSVVYRKTALADEEIKSILDKYTRNEPVGAQTPFVF